MSNFELFRTGALSLCSEDGKFSYTKIHAQHGISEADWNVLRQKEPWSPVDRRKMKGVLAEIVQITFTISGLPAARIPAEYIAAVVSVVVAPTNCLIAAQEAPLGFDTAKATGLFGPSVVEDVTREKMSALILAYVGGHRSGPRLSSVKAEGK